MVKNVRGFMMESDVALTAAVATIKQMHEQLKETKPKGKHRRDIRTRQAPAINATIKSN